MFICSRLGEGSLTLFSFAEVTGAVIRLDSKGEGRGETGRDIFGKRPLKKRENERPFGNYCIRTSRRTMTRIMAR
jgi:hypothetical protein